MSQLDIAFRYAGQRFAGSDYDAAVDNKRLGAQIQRIFNLMRDGEWRTLGEIERATDYP